MRTLRTAVGMIGVLLMAGGYFASQYAYWVGDPAAYSKALDTSAVPYLSLVLLVGAVALAFVPEKVEEAK
ncbi:MAG: hypothetical protein JSS66_11240 [Armatimonadetes bacterium]|nr:hypothetical protein [Armatimonadota bacterium]